MPDTIPSISAPIKNQPVVPVKVSKVRRLIFFDLDNTLIPTSWIMQHWKSAESRAPQHQIVREINNALAEAGLFDAIDSLLKQVTRVADKVHIVTNAGLRTVDNFYLTHTLPQLKYILREHNVSITSTEEWVVRDGPAPNPEEDEAFREFYTVVKYTEFKESAKEALEKWDDEEVKVDIISIGDQMCEISAACRLTEEYGDAINLIKLILILDPSNARFSDQTPASFVRHVRNLTDHVMWLISRNKSTTLENGENFLKAANEQDAPESDPVIDKSIYWFPMPHNLTYAVGTTKDTPKEGPSYLQVEYMDAVYSHESLWEILGGHRSISDQSSTACDSVFDAEVPCKLTTQSDGEEANSELNLY